MCKKKKEKVEKVVILCWTFPKVSLLKDSRGCQISYEWILECFPLFKNNKVRTVLIRYASLHLTE